VSPLRIYKWWGYTEDELAFSSVVKLTDWIFALEDVREYLIGETDPDCDK